MQNPTISIAICTFNRCEYLVECIESAILQSYQGKYEILIIDNNSSDGTKEICEDFIKRESLSNRIRIRYYLETTQGLSYARNRALQECASDIITYVDDDSILDKHFIQEIINTFLSNPNLDLVGGEILPKFQEKEPKWRNPFTESAFFSQHSPSVNPFYYKHKYPFGGNMSMKSALLKKIGGFNPNLGRKGNSALGAEEKAIAILINNGNNTFYNPKIKILHQIDNNRLLQKNLDRISRGIGISSRVMAGDKLISVASIFLIMIFKYFAAIGIGVFYATKERNLIKLNHLHRFRFQVLIGFFNGK